MLNRLLTLFRRRPRRPGPPTTTSKNGESLTYSECKFIHKELRCPDCRIGLLAAGPEGGCSINIACVMCGSEFCVCFMQSGVAGERISDMGPREVRDRKQLYGMILSRERI
jgi:hypothetical protein